MKILILGLNYYPEPTGIAVYTEGLATGLKNRGHNVEIVTSFPYYPDWKVKDNYRSYWYKSDSVNGVSVIRCPIYVPHNPKFIGRILHHLSFAISALIPMIHRTRKMRPNLILTVAPSLIAAPVVKVAAKISGAKTWLHVQDFEVEAGLATGQLSKKVGVAKLAASFEKYVFSIFDYISSISYEMVTRLVEKGRGNSEIFELRNWADIQNVAPQSDSQYRKKWQIGDRQVVLYSGSIAKKQGIELLINAAREMQDRNDLVFIICGNGPNRKKLEKSAADLSNCLFYDLQPKHQLSELLALAKVHIIPQKTEAADLVLPSKLTNMLASGRPVIVCAAEGTGLAREVENCGLVAEPENLKSLVSAISNIIEDKKMYKRFSINARKRAMESWNQNAIIDSFDEKLRSIIRL